MSLFTARLNAPKLSEGPICAAIAQGRALPQLCPALPLAGPGRARARSHTESALATVRKPALARSHSGCLSLPCTGMQRPAFASLGPVRFCLRRHRVGLPPRLRFATLSLRFAHRARAQCSAPANAGTSNAAILETDPGPAQPSPCHMLLICQPTRECPLPRRYQPLQRGQPGLRPSPTSGLPIPGHLPLMTARITAPRTYPHTTPPGAGSYRGGCPSGTRRPPPRPHPAGSPRPAPWRPPSPPPCARPA